MPGVSLRHTGGVSYPGTDERSGGADEPAERSGQGGHTGCADQAGQPPEVSGNTGDAGDAGPVRVRVEPPEELGGDPACWLNRVCPECGRITEGRDADRCASCGEPLPFD